jgi:hypothetical protein
VWFGFVAASSKYVQARKDVWRFRAFVVRVNSSSRVSLARLLLSPLPLIDRDFRDFDPTCREANKAMHSFPNLRDLERTHGITWHELVDLEPKLAQLLWESRQACVICRSQADVDRIFAPIRNSLADLVGFARRHHWHPVLGSLGAYEVAYWKLYSAVAAMLLGRTGGVEEAMRDHRERTGDRARPAELAATAFAEV